MDNKMSKLQKEWYKKLKDSGFEDLEYFENDGDAKDWLKGTSKYQSTANSTQTEYLEAAFAENELIYNNTLDYYLQVSHSLNTIQFDSDTHKKIWELHGEGLSLREIAKIVNFSHPKVLRIINQYRTK